MKLLGLSRLAKSTGNKATPAARKAQRARLELECLEGREVPTVAFNPNFGAESVAAGSNYNNLQDPAVNLIFAGSYWTSPQGVPDRAFATSAVQQIFRGPYLSGLTQYGSDGQARLGFSLPTSSTVQGQPFSDAVKKQVNTFINDFLNHNSLPPGTSDAQHESVYVVVLDPTDSAAESTQPEKGWNDRGTYTNATGSDSQGIHMIFLGTGQIGGALDRDGFTNTFSHELVETMTDGIQVNAGNKLPSSLLGKGNLQIGDNEPDGGRYDYRVEGLLIQAYWSVKDNAYIVPDGMEQRFTLTPLWNGDNFSGRSQLFVLGDQYGANSNDVVSLNQGANGGLALGLNFESANFEPGQIFFVQINTAGGANAVKLYAVPWDVTGVSVTDFGGTDNVTVGAGGSLSGILPGTDISVDHVNGLTSLTIDGNNDGAQTVSLFPDTVEFEGRFIDFFTHQQNGQTSGVTSVTLEVGNGSQVIANAISPTTMFTLWWTPGETVTGPAAGQIQMKYLDVPLSWYFSVASGTPVMTLTY